MTWQTRLTGTSPTSPNLCIRLTSIRANASDAAGRHHASRCARTEEVSKPLHKITPSAAEHPPPPLASTRLLEQALTVSQGGRTAWSSTVEVNGKTYQARYWYDGTYSNNAMEDAAEVALIRLGLVAGPSRR